MHIKKKNFIGKAIEDKMNHYRHELLYINNWYKLFNFYTSEIIVFLCGRISITHHDHIVFIIFEFNDETIIMHFNTLYVSNMKPLIKIHFVMYHGKCTSLKMAEGDYTCIFYMLDTSFLFEQETIHGPTAQYFYGVYVSTIILLL